MSYEKLLKEAVDGFMDDEKAPEINDDYRRYVTESVIENQIKFNHGINESDEPTNQTSGVKNFDPVLIKMVRRSMPKLMAFDLTGVQPMSGPTGSIFAMRSRYTNQSGSEALFNEADSQFSGDQNGTAQAGDTSGFSADYFGTGDPAESTTYGTGMSTTDAEQLGSPAGDAWNEMAFTIERTDVSAKSRKLKAQFSRELQYDLKNIHNLDAETELANILSTEITAEIDRELLRTINVAAVVGAQSAATPGRFDLSTDSDGRWLVERFKGLIFQIELEANRVSIDTRRGKANRVVCSSNVASALNMAGVLDYNPQMAVNMNVDPSGNTYAGVLLGKYQVYIDPYAAIDYVTVGYRGANAWDAGVYYCPYLPLEMYRAQGEDNFNPKVGFATRYGIIANPFEHNDINGARPGKGLGQGENRYFRKFAVSNIQG
ncbi:MAG: hypothetical protein R3230_00725 [Nitrosopumilaceae archaeon]|nr:hypothetical protein [Nitrosopumilaceae archaeon]